MSSYPGDNIHNRYYYDADEADDAEHDTDNTADLQNWA